MSKSFTALLVASVAVLAGLFLLLRPKDEVAAVPAGGGTTFSLLLRDGRLASGPTLLRVQQGDQIRLTVTSNRADELHLHGYDLELELQPDTPAMLEFPATRSGHFDIELHEARAEIGALEVMPQ